MPFVGCQNPVHSQLGALTTRQRIGCRHHCG